MNVHHLEIFDIVYKIENGKHQALDQLNTESLLYSSNKLYGLLAYLFRVMFVH